MIHALRISLAIIALSLLASCTPTTGTKIAVNQSEISKIKSIGVLVKKDEDFSVRLSREEMSNTGAAFGLIGVGIEAAVRRSSDKDKEEQIKPSLGNFDPQAPLTERLRFHLQEGAIATSEVTDGGEKTAADAILEVTVRQWGLRRCPGPAPEVVQAGFNVNGKLYRASGHATVWEREELYLNGDCRPWSMFRSEELANDILPRALDALATKLVYEILYP
jgi:hypothetical protein